MATQTTHYHLIKPESADRVAIGNINDNSDTIDGYLYKANERADQLADDYNPSLIYNTDDYVRRENYLYKCNTDNTTGTWDATKWDRVKVMDEITQGGGGGGSSTLAGLNDVSVSGIVNKDIIRYNSTTRKYEKSSDLTDLELSVSQLSSSVLSIAGDVDALELTVSQMSASTLPYDANTSTKQKIDNVESSIPTDASNLPYDSTSSGLTATNTQDAIDEVNSKLPGTKTLLVSQSDSASTTYNIDISGYDELYCELRYYGGAFSTMTYRILFNGTYRIYGFVDATTNFASSSIQVSNSRLTSVSIPNFVGAGTSVAIYGIKY